MGAPLDRRSAKRGLELGKVLDEQREGAAGEAVELTVRGCTDAVGSALAVQERFLGVREGVGE